MAAAMLPPVTGSRRIASVAAALLTAVFVKTEAGAVVDGAVKPEDEGETGS